MEVLLDLIRWLTGPDQWHGFYGIPNRLLQHLGYTSATVLIAVVIAVPLGLIIGHTGRFHRLVVTSTGSMRALPTLGLLTAMVLWRGVSLDAVLLALVVLAIPPVLAGAYSGVESVDPATVDAARAMGMTEFQVLTRVEVPLALPLIAGGIRSAAVQVVATATVAGYVGLGGLGRFLFDGLAVQDYPQMLGGSVIVVALALLLDGVGALLQRVGSGGHVQVMTNTKV